MKGLYLVYTWYTWYILFISGIYSFSGFRGQHHTDDDHSRPDPVPQDILDNVLPDPDDLADFELPDQQALIDAFLSQGQFEAVPVTVAYKWTAEELTATIKLIKSTDFKVEDVNVDLHKRVAAATAQGHFTSHNMRESDLDGDQDLNFWIRSLEEKQIPVIYLVYTRITKAQSIYQVYV